MRAATGAAAALVAVIVVVAVVILSSGGNEYLVRAEFRNADGLRSGFYVDVGQLQAGVVKDVTVNRQGLAVVTMSLGHGAYPIGAGAQATIRPVNLLGEEYVDLTPGDRKHPLPSGAAIPATRTGVSVDLDRILDMVDPTTAARLRILINESGVALSGQGSNFNALLSALPGSLQQLGTMISGFAQDNQNLRTLITQGDQVISSADSRRVDLQRLITNAEQTLSVVAGRRAQLAATVGSATPGLQQLNATLVRLQSVAADLQPTAVDISQTAPYLANTLAQLPSFAAAANPALAEAKASAPYIDRLSTRATPTVRSLTPTLSNLKRFATLLQPTMTTLADQGAFQSILRFANNWATLTDLSDGLGHVFRVHLTIDPQTLGFPGTTLGSTQSKRPRSAGKRPPAGCTSCATTPTAPRASGSPGSQPRGAGPAKPAPAPTITAPQPGSNPPPSEPGTSGNPVTNITGLLQYLFGS